MKFHMLMFMNAWMMLVLMKCKCQMQCLTLGCYNLFLEAQQSLESSLLHLVRLIINLSYSHLHGYAYFEYILLS